MADPNTNFDSRTSDPAGVGPYQFDVDALAPGETYTLDLRSRERGRFVSLSPAGYDSLQVTNKNSSVTLRVTVNETNSIIVPPNSVQSLEMDGMYRYDVRNAEPDGGASIDADDVTLNVLKEPYGADEQARKQRQENPLRSVVRHFTGI